MNLEQEILSNPLKNYLYILGVILATYILKRFVSRFFASIIYTWVDKKIIQSFVKVMCIV